MYDPPEGPPPGWRPLKDVTFAPVHDEHWPKLAARGWTTVTSAPDTDALVTAAAAFFAQPAAAKEVPGYTHIAGEKQLLTLTSPTQFPPAAAIWTQARKLLLEALAAVERSLAMPPGALSRFDGTHSILRVFDYEGAGLVAEPHCDLGLLTLVVSTTPGLEVWDDGWVPIERNSIAGTLLVGTELAFLTNGRYSAGRHRVVADGPRYSVVFALRAHWPTPIDYTTLSTPITGTFAGPPTAGELAQRIRATRYNINGPVEGRKRPALAQSAQSPANLSK
ncbi:hypothetical protein EJ06DRAFT_534006 [Trichodelitschia bisporula]|uniref:Fe2OG dioxygenase domain-containing protein n=1 Tax=Trichodelitschia bisporula TaxID=703511 RepID=A0A6G1HJT3_9PEZI|nr:hypothetical protein EJ06DRAFT_534006 [Trichodelitschia bisporula]